MLKPCAPQGASSSDRSRTLREITIRGGRWLAAVAGIVTATACSTMPDGSRWGEHARLDVGWGRVGEAALQAATSPWVWGPLAGAAVLQVDHWDEHASSWATEHTPVFGSVNQAKNWSDYLEATSAVAYVASVVATPGGNLDADWWLAKARGGLVGLGAIGAASLATEGLKSVVTRERPDGNARSFPSGHATFAGAADTLTVRNLQSIELGEPARSALTVGVDALTFATGWARVEAGAHYPSDVLVGMSIGNFFGRMFSDAFLNDGVSERLALAFAPAPGGGQLTWAWRF
jgi:membrane-associated phospholipid phosphatase